jgi:uncharacterized protein YegL
MGFQNDKKKATAFTPQVVALIIDDSGSMQGQKAFQASEAVQDMMVQMQGWNQGSSGYRYLLNIAKFGNQVVPLALASAVQEVNLQQLKFAGEGGGTEMPAALRWAAQAIEQSLQRCRQIPRYNENAAPPPLCIFFSDGENTSSEPMLPAIQALHSISFQGGPIDVVACGIGMSSSAFAVMKQISSRPELAVNIDPDKIGEFIAEVGATFEKGDSPDALVNRAAQL